MQSRSATSIGLLVCIPHRFLAKFFLLTLSPHDLRLLPRVPLLLLRIAYFSLLVLKVLRLTRLRKNCRRDCLRTLYASFMPGHARPFAPPMRLPVVTCFPAGSACCTCRSSPCSRRPTSCSAASRSFCAQCSACCTCRSSPCSRRPTSCGAASRSSSSRSGGSSLPAPLQVSARRQPICSPTLARRDDEKRRRHHDHVRRRQGWHYMHDRREQL
mmetsp:Transcript_6544/g.23210  ORF Transcript_6544/g.23210 Transcript_6544/m.23210 type:complete len:214 (+) Transcript_6544:670-1311(+)